MTDIIQQALAQLGQTLREPAQEFTYTQAAKDFCCLTLAQLERESFLVLYLNTQHQLIDGEILFAGTLDGCAIYPREVARRALQVNAKAVILAHNHPSGHIAPSQADHAITKRLQQALALLDINVLDHIIVGRNQTYSMAEHEEL